MLLGVSYEIHTHNFSFKWIIVLYLSSVFASPQACYSLSYLIEAVRHALTIQSHVLLGQPKTSVFIRCLCFQPFVFLNYKLQNAVPGHFNLSLPTWLPACILTYLPGTYLSGELPPKVHHSLILDQSTVTPPSMILEDFNTKAQLLKEALANATPQGIS